MNTFSSGMLCEVTGIPHSVLNAWIKEGFLGQEVAGGSGHHRTFTMGQLLAMGVGERYRNEGAPHARVEGVVRFLAEHSLEWIEAEIAQGRTIPVPPDVLKNEKGPAVILRQGLMVEPPLDAPPTIAKLLQKLDVGVIFKELKAKVDKAARKPVKPGRGRKRLVTNY